MKLKLFFMILLPLFYYCSSNPTSSENDSDYLVIFTSDRDSDGLINIEMGTKRDVYAMAMDGSNPTRLTNNNRYNYNPLCSVDGAYIVFRSSADWLIDNVHLMNADGTNEIDLGAGKFPKFSHDNTKILYQSAGLISLMNSDGSSKVLLTSWADSIYNTLGQDFPAQFSSDDSKILFFSRKGNNSDIYTMSIDGTNMQRLTSDPAYDLDCSFSDDDSKILFTSWRTGTAQIYLMDHDGNNKTPLTTEGHNYNARFSPDGNDIVFMSDRDGVDEIYLMDSDGSNQKRITNMNGPKREAIFSPDGKYILFSGKENKYNIFSINIKNGALLNLTNDMSNNLVSSCSPLLN